MLVVERHYLRKHGELGSSGYRPWLTVNPGASFAENFYGLKRRRRPFIEAQRVQAAVGGLPAGEALHSREIWRSLVFLVRGMRPFGYSH